MPAPTDVPLVGDKTELTAAVSNALGRDNDLIRTVTAPDASEGEDNFSDNSFDCVVAEYDLPGQNGTEFLQAVREQYPELPFILCERTDGRYPRARTVRSGRASVPRPELAYQDAGRKPDSRRGTPLPAGS